MEYNIFIVDNYPEHYKLRFNKSSPSCYVVFDKNVAPCHCQSRFNFIKGSKEEIIGLLAGEFRGRRNGVIIPNVTSYIMELDDYPLDIPVGTVMYGITNNTIWIDYLLDSIIKFYSEEDELVYNNIHG